MMTPEQLLKMPCLLAFDGLSSRVEGKNRAGLQEIHPAMKHAVLRWIAGGDAAGLLTVG